LIRTRSFRAINLEAHLVMGGGGGEEWISYDLSANKLKIQSIESLYPSYTHFCLQVHFPSEKP
jgi:hypothetical protein